MEKNQEPKDNEKTMKIKTYLGMIKIYLNDRFKYRFNFFMTFFSSFLYSILYFMLWKAVYFIKPSQVMNYKDLVTYLLVAQACNFSRWSPAERFPVYETAKRIQNGDISLDLLRPIDFQIQKLCESIGFFFTEFLLVNIPLFFIFYFFFHVNLSQNAISLLGFMASGNDFFQQDHFQQAC